jgi:hypothetical protein
MVRWDILQSALLGTLEPRESEEREVTALLVAAGCAGAAAFGAVTGGSYGGMQILSSAAKLPFVLLLPLVVCLPALHWSHGFLGAAVPWRALVREGALVVARTGLGLLVGMPFLWIAQRLHPPHALTVQAVALIVALAFFASVQSLFRQGPRLHRLAATALLALTLGQTCWVLRPFVGDEGQPFRWFEDPRGSFVQGLLDPTYQELP